MEKIGTICYFDKICLHLLSIANIELALQYTTRIMQTVTGLLCLAEVCYVLILAISFRVSSLSLRQSCTTLKKMDEWITWISMITTKTWWRHQMETFPHQQPFVRGFHRWPVNSPHQRQWRGTLMFSLVCGWTNGWANNKDAGDLRCHCNATDNNISCLI